jgi:general secretion pathway protein M
MTGWWTQLSDRDRRVLLVGAVLAGVLRAWAFIWQPMQSRRSLLVEQLDNAHRDLAFVRVGEAEVERLRSSGVQSRADRQGKSLLALADLTARGANLDGVLKRLEPVGSKSVRATFEFAPFDSIVAWLEGLSRDYGVKVSDFSSDRVDATGLVNARITLDDVP